MSMIFEMVDGREAALQFLKSTDKVTLEPCSEADATLIKVTFTESGETLWLTPTDEEPEDPRDVPDMPGQQDPDLDESEQ